MELARVIRQLEDLEDRRATGMLRLPDGGRLEVGQLHKVFWPEPRITKGELMRYYVRVSPLILPAVRDRPFIMRRHPDGVRAGGFYQQRAPADTPPAVRTAVLASDRVVPRRLVGGSLATLIFMTQIGALSQDPWFSRVHSEDTPDHCVIDLDPMPGVAFRTVVDVARWVAEELERLGVPSFPKTSGKTGLHVYIPLRPRTTYETSRRLAELVATAVATKHPRVATVERRLRQRGPRVYVDFLQNARGKTLATAYSASASEDAGVSTPLTWAEVDAGIDRRDFALRTIEARVRDAGDLWADFRRARGADLSAVVSGSRRREPSRPRRPRELRGAR